jgi:hypothetical protein
MTTIIIYQLLLTMSMMITDKRVRLVRVSEIAYGLTIESN